MKHTTITATPPAHLTKKQYEKWIYIQMIKMYPPFRRTGGIRFYIVNKRKKKRKKLAETTESTTGNIYPAFPDGSGDIQRFPLILEHHETCTESREESVEGTPDKELYQVFDLEKLKRYALKSCTATEIYAFTRMLSALTRQQKLYPEVLMKTIDELEAHAHELRQKKQSARHRPKKEEEPIVCEYAVFNVQPDFPVVRFTRLHQFLTAIKWLDAQSGHKDFEALFAGGINRCRNIWNRKQGKGKLHDLFQMMMDKKFIECPPGHGYLQIVESHFVDCEGNPITGLRGGNHAKSAEQVLLACEKILNGETDKCIREADNINRDYFEINELYPEHLHEEDYLSAKTSARRK